MLYQLVNFLFAIKESSDFYEFQMSTKYDTVLMYIYTILVHCRSIWVICV
jgi:hypothetical protein